MVYSQTKRTASIASITNRPQGGGNKKAGFPYLVGRDSWTSIAFKGTSQKLSVLQMPLTSTTRQSRPIGVTPSNGRYFSMM
jgi:hypothetical protein